MPISECPTTHKRILEFSFFLVLQLERVVSTYQLRFKTGREQSVTNRLKNYYSQPVTKKSEIINYKLNKSEKKP